jgi:hypothetical protein
MRTVNEKAMERAAKVLPSTALEPVRVPILTTTGEICQEVAPSRDEAAQPEGYRSNPQRRDCSWTTRTFENGVVATKRASGRSRPVAKALRRQR